MTVIHLRMIKLPPRFARLTLAFHASSLVLTGDVHAVSPAGKSRFWGGQLSFGGHVSHSTVHQMTKDEPHPG